MSQDNGSGKIPSMRVIKSGGIRGLARTGGHAVIAGTKRGAEITGQILKGTVDIGRGAIMSGVHTTEDVVAAGLGNLIDAVGHLPGSTEKAEDVHFFADIEDQRTAPVTLVITTSDHPDTVLRRSGIIEERAMHKRMYPAVYDPRKGEWVLESNGKPIRHAELLRYEQSLHSRVDFVPSGIIRVMGSVRDPERIHPDEYAKNIAKSPADVELSVHGREVNQSDTEMEDIVDTKNPFNPSELVSKIRSEKERENERKERRAIDNKPDEDEDSYTAQDLARFFGQYLSNGVVEAAKRTGSAIFAPGTGKMAVALAAGVHTTQEKSTGHQPVRAKTMLVGITPFSEKLLGKPPEVELNRFYTHHLVIERDIKATVQTTEESEVSESGLATQMRSRGVLSGGVVRKGKPKPCKGFRCAHVDDEYQPVEGDRPVHFRCNLPIPNYGLENRICECGYILYHMEVAQCVCGKFDFDHVPLVAKRQRYRALRNRIHDEDHRQWFSQVIVTVTKCPTVAEVHATVTDIVSTLAHGFSETDATPAVYRLPPHRTSIPVVTVLFNGDPAIEKFDLVKHVQKRWPIVAIEGSGGYADILCNTILRVQHIVRDRDVSVASQQEGEKPVVAEAGLDEYRKFLSGIDSFTAELIINGRVEVIKKGTRGNEFIRKVENCLGGDETLTKAWLKYATWKENAQAQEKRYFRYQRTILLLGILTTGLSVLQTYLLLLWGEEEAKTGHNNRPPTFPDRPVNKTGESYINWILWTILQWSIIALPIAISFLQAIANKDQAGAKWVSLRTNSEALLSEIYKYRTRTLGYSADQIKKHARHGGYKGVEYSTREELLQQQAKRFTDLISESEVAGVTLTPYQGPLPPRNIRREGDDGFSDLGPDKYIRVRLEAKISELQRQARLEGYQVLLTNTLINIFNGAGTLLASLAAYGHGSLQAWVAFTNAVASALTRFLDYTRMEWMQKKINTTINNLMNVASWWASLASGADTKENRDTLVMEVESLLLDEVDSWGKLINSTIGKTTDSKGDEGGDRKGDDNDGQDESARLKEVGSKFGIELEDLAPAKIVEAIKDPTGTSAKAISDTMKKLGEIGVAPTQKEVRLHRNPTEELGLVFKGALDLTVISVEKGSPAARHDLQRFVGSKLSHVNGAVVESVSQVNETAGRFRLVVLRFADGGGRKRPVSALNRSPDDRLTHCLKVPALGQCDTVPAGEIRETIQHADTRLKFLTQLQDMLGCSDGMIQQQLSRWLILEEAKRLPDLHRQIHVMPTRQLLEVVKFLIIEQIVTMFTQVELPIDKLRIKVRKHDLIPEATVDQDPLEPAEIFVSEWRTLAQTAGIMQLGGNSLINIIKDPSVKAKVRALDPAVRNALRKLAVEIWGGSRLHGIAVLLREVVEMIADLDIAELLENVENRVRLWAKLPQIQEFVTEAKVRLLSKNQMLEYLPQNMAKRLRGKSLMQVQEYMVRLSLGTPASRIFRVMSGQHDALVHGESIAAEVFHPERGSPELRERFVIAVSTLTQSDINRMSKGLLLRKLKICPVYNDRVEELVNSMKEDDIRFLMSAIQSRISNTYATRLIDSVADEILSFDVREVVSYEDAEKIVRKIKEFRLMRSRGKDETLEIVEIDKLSKVELLHMLGYRTLVEKLEYLTLQQLRDLLENLLALSSRSFPLQVFLRLREGMLSTFTQIGISQDEFMEWDPDFIEAMVSAVSELKLKNIEAWMKRNPSAGPYDLISRIGANTDIASGLRESVDRVRMHVEDPTVLKDLLLELFKSIQKFGGESFMANAFETAIITTELHCVLQPRHEEEGQAAELPNVHDLFDSHEAREVFCERLLGLDTLESHILLLEQRTERHAPLMMKGEDVLLETLFGDQGSGESVEQQLKARLQQLVRMRPGMFVILLANIITEMTSEAPLRLFHALANTISLFDLRDILTGYTNRRRLVYLVFEMTFEPLGAESPSYTTAGVLDRVTGGTVEMAQKWLGRSIGDIPASERVRQSAPPDVPPSPTVQAPEGHIRSMSSMSFGQPEHPPGKWRLSFLKEAGRLGPQYTSLINDLRVLTEVQLKVLVEELHRILSTTLSGKVFVHYLDMVQRRIGRGDTTWHDWVALTDALDLMKQRMKVQPTVITTAFEQFSAKAFVKKSREVKEHMLMSIIDDERAVRILSAMRQDELEEKVFLYLDRFRPMAKDSLMKATKRRHGTKWKRVRDAVRKSMVHFDITEQEVISALQTTPGSEYGHKFDA